MKRREARPDDDDAYVCVECGATCEPGEALCLFHLMLESGPDASDVSRLPHAADGHGAYKLDGFSVSGENRSSVADAVPFELRARLSRAVIVDSVPLAEAASVFGIKKSTAEKIVTRSLAERSTEPLLETPDGWATLFGEDWEGWGNYSEPFPAGMNAMYGRKGKLREIAVFILRGEGDRETARLARCSKDTVRKLRRVLVAIAGREFLCPCGSPGNHRGWCSYRFAKSEVRQQWMEQWQQRRRPNGASAKPESEPWFERPE